MELEVNETIDEEFIDCLKKKSNFSKKINIIFILVLILIVGYLFRLLVISNYKEDEVIFKYIASNDNVVNICMLNSNEYCIDISRGNKVIVNNIDKVLETSTIIYNEELYMISNDNLVDDLSNIVLEEKMYVRTSLSLLENFNSSKIVTLIKKGQKVDILGYYDLNIDGSIRLYEVSYGDFYGYVYSKYLVDSYEDAILNYDEDGSYLTHLSRVDKFGGGNAGDLDYYPNEKVGFVDNIMPNEVRSLYISNSSNVISNIDAYIDYALSVNINTFIVDIKDNESPGYESSVMKMYSITNYNYANNSYDDYKKAITKIRDAGFYVVGRITVFKDKYYVLDNPGSAIIDTNTNEPILLNSSYWPTAYDRDVWEFNLELAKEAVNEMGFHEIQFDYVRFPDRTYSLESNGSIDFLNVYEESKAQAIQNFLMYVTDELHLLGVYVSADVFGESAHSYVSAYGQYWPAISNVVDVISGMPYPDHFSNSEYGFSIEPYKVPYDILYYWGKNFVMVRQSEIPTPAIVRTWIQAYDALPGDFPYYNNQIEEQIQGLYDAGLDGGFMPWNSSSSLGKYKSYEEAFLKEYLIADI